MPTPAEQQKEAERLKSLFKEKSPLSQKEFAEEYGLGTPANLGQYLNGYRPLNVRLALLIANALNIKISDFSPRLAREIRKLGLDPNLADKNPDAVRIPILTAKQVVQYGETKTLPNVDDSPHLYGVSPEDDNCLAITIEHDPMAPDYLKGDTLVFSPAMKPNPGDDVVAIWKERYTDEMQCTVRGYILTTIDDNGEPIFELQTRITSYQPLNSQEVECKIIGVVLECRRGCKIR